MNICQVLGNRGKKAVACWQTGSWWGGGEGRAGFVAVADVCDVNAPSGVFPVPTRLPDTISECLTSAL